MSEQDRTLLTWVCLIIVGPAIYWFIRGDQAADFVFTSMGGGDRMIRNRVSLGKRFLISMAVSLFLCIQGVLPLWPEVRTILFFMAIVFMAWAAFFVWRGYHLWKEGLREWVNHG